MRSLVHFVGHSLAALLTAGLLAMPADADAAAVVVTTAPVAPVQVWVPGRWTVRLGRHVWVEGGWEVRPPPPHMWVPGHWEGRGRTRTWVPGHLQ